MKTQAIERLRCPDCGMSYESQSLPEPNEIVCQVCQHTVRLLSEAPTGLKENKLPQAPVVALIGLTLFLGILALQFPFFHFFLLGALVFVAVERIQVHAAFRSASLAGWHRLKYMYANYVQANRVLRSELAEANARYERISPERRDSLAAEIQILGQLPVLRSEKENLLETITKLKSRVISFEEEELLQSFGFYQPLYDCADSEQFRRLLDQVRERQKVMVREKQALIFDKTFSITGDRAASKKIVGSLEKLILRAFNGECDATIDNVTFSNFDAIKARITKCYNDLNNLCEMVGVAITQAYLNLKIEELQVCHEYKMKLKDEREEQRKIREEMREQALRAKEIEEAEQKIKKDENHFNAAIEDIRARMQLAAESDRQEYLKKIQEYKDKLSGLEKAKVDVEYRKIHARAGHVYIISNIGSFGQDVYKIGVSLRQDPQDRIDELSGAAVPFEFDVHAKIFSEDAFSLESALHQKFADRRVNQLNTRKEFFHVKLDEIERVVRTNHNTVVEFVRTPNAEDYRLTLAKSGNHVPALDK